MGKNNRINNKRYQNNNGNHNNIGEVQNNFSQQNIPIANNPLGLDQNNIRVNIPTNVVLIDSKEYMQLYNENRELKEKICQLYSNERTLQQTIENGKATIEELRKENNELKEKLSKVERELRDTNEELQSLKSLFNKELTKNKYKKYLVAIQDTNRYYQLESNMNRKYAKTLHKLRENRVDECHYINDNGDQSEKDFRVKILHDKLKNMDEGTQVMFDKRYPDLINGLLSYITPINNDVDDDIIDDVNFWWDL